MSTVSKFPERSEKYDRLVSAAEDLGEPIHLAVEKARADGLNPIWIIGVLDSAKFEIQMGPVGFEGEPA